MVEIKKKQEALVSSVRDPRAEQSGKLRLAATATYASQDFCDRLLAVAVATNGPICLLLLTWYAWLVAGGSVQSVQPGGTRLLQRPANPSSWVILVLSKQEGAGADLPRFQILVERLKTQSLRRTEANGTLRVPIPPPPAPGK